MACPQAGSITLLSLLRFCGSPAVCVDPGLTRTAARVRLARSLPLKHTKCGRVTKSRHAQVRQLIGSGRWPAKPGASAVVTSRSKRGLKSLSSGRVFTTVTKAARCIGSPLTRLNAT